MAAPQPPLAADPTFVAKPISLAYLASPKCQRRGSAAANTVIKGADGSVGRRSARRFAATLGNRFRSRNQSALTGGGPTACPAREPKLAPVNSKNSIFNGSLHPHAADVAWPPPPERGSISQPDSTRSPTRWPLAGPQPDQVMPLRQDCALTSARRGWPLLSPQPGRDFTT
jgi:hypothetical protein